MEHIRLDTIEDAIKAIQSGQIVIVVDDAERENEGDFVCAADQVTPAIINFMATHGRGLICTPLEEERADALKLDLMVNSNSSLHETAFTVSVDLIGHGCTTGISAQDRAQCIKALLDPSMEAHHFARPGHIFPLRSKSGGVLRRTGHTEASIDLAKLAGCYPAGVVVEILNADGTMARLPDLLELATRFQLKIVSIQDLVAYRLRTETTIERVFEKTLKDWHIILYRHLPTNDLHLAITLGTWKLNEVVPVRVQVAGMIPDILNEIVHQSQSIVSKAIQQIKAEGKGAFICLYTSDWQESILKSIEQWSEQYPKQIAVDKTPSEQTRDIGLGAQIIRDLGIRKMKLLTQQPRKIIGLEGYGLELIETISLTSH